MDDVQLLRSSAYRRVAWKNGGGVTDVVAVASSQDPAWRISVARIEHDGAFSDFGGYDRTIVVLGGAGVTLALASGNEVRLSALAPFSFPGEGPVEARLAGGPSRDLNIMTRRETHRHDVAVIGVGENGVPVDAGDACGFLYIADGTIDVDGRVGHAGDTIRLEGNIRTVARGLAGPATVILARIFARRSLA